MKQEKYVNIATVHFLYVPVIRMTLVIHVTYHCLNVTDIMMINEH